jgi:hypothetical protein
MQALAIPPDALDVTRGTDLTRSSGRTEIVAWLASGD